MIKNQPWLIEEVCKSLKLKECDVYLIFSSISFAMQEYEQVLNQRVQELPERERHLYASFSEKIMESTNDFAEMVFRSILFGYAEAHMNDDEAKHMIEQLENIDLLDKTEEIGEESE
jgi:hypothetical protein